MRISSASYNWSSFYCRDIYKILRSSTTHTCCMSAKHRVWKHKPSCRALQQVSWRDCNWSQILKVFILLELEMALSGTILPSISTFSTQKEKCWENVSISFLFYDDCAVLYFYMYYIHISTAFLNYLANFKLYSKFVSALNVNKSRSKS